jgi:hypothetical protein
MTMTVQEHQHATSTLLVAQLNWQLRRVWIVFAGPVAVLGGCSGPIEVQTRRLIFFFGFVLLEKESRESNRKQET